MNQQQAQAEELLFVVDENDLPLRPLPRREVHSYGIWHRTAHIWLVNDAQEVLCHQRSPQKEQSPSKWDARFGGHLAPEETYLRAAARELYEETGLRFSDSDFKLWNIYKHCDPKELNNEFQGVFVVRWNGSSGALTFDDGEVEQAAWRPDSEIRRLLLESNSWVGGSGYAPGLLEELSE